MPKYRIHETSHIDDKIIEPGTEIETHSRHIPGPHWEPLDDEARKICKKAGHKFGNVPDPIEALMSEKADAEVNAGTNTGGDLAN